MNYNTNQEGSVMVVNKKNTGLIVGLGLLFLLLVGIGGLFYYKLNYSKNRFIVFIENTFDYLREGIESNSSKSLSGTFSFQVMGWGNAQDSNQILDLISKLDFSLEYGVDSENQLFRLDMATRYGQQKLLNAQFYMENENGYLYLDELYDKNIQIPIQDSDRFFNQKVSTDDYRVIYNSIEKALVDSLKEEYFIKEKVTLDSKKVEKTTLKLDQKIYQEIKDSFVSQLLGDEKFLDSMSDVLDKDVQEIKKSFQDILEDQDEIHDLDIHLYISGHDFVQFEIDGGVNKMIVKTNGSDEYFYSLYENEKVFCDGNIQIRKNGDQSTVVMIFNDKEDDLSIQFTATSSIKKDVKIDKKDVKNSIPYDEISQEELQEIYMKVLENEGMLKLIQEISGLRGDLSNSTFSGSIKGKV